MTYEEFRNKIKPMGYNNVSIAKMFGVNTNTVASWARPERSGIPEWAINFLTLLEEKNILEKENKILKDILISKE